MRPVAKGTDPPYTTKTTFTFAGGNATIIKQLLNRSSAANIPFAQCLNLWLVSAKGQVPPNGVSVNDFKRAIGAIETQVGNVYKLASVPLTQRLGPYCSFCETPLAGLLEVEHRVPKSLYPTFALSWINFLLACSPCNTAKGNEPPRAEVAGWLGNPTNPTEQQFYDEIVLHYVWPDMDEKSFEWLPVRLEYYDSTGNTWKTMRMDWATNLKNEILSVSIAERRIIARIHDPNSDNYNDVQVRAVVQSGSVHDDAEAMIGLCQLNAAGNEVSTYDRRMLNRTQAWFSGLKCLSYVAQAPSPEVRQIFWNMMLMTAVATGFYSVWLGLLDHLDHDAALQFVADTNVANMFPGTNTTDLP